MLTMKYLMKSLGFSKARGVFSDGKGDYSGWTLRPRPQKPKPEKPDFIKEGEFKV